MTRGMKHEIESGIMCGGVTKITGWMIRVLSVESAWSSWSLKNV